MAAIDSVEMDGEEEDAMLEAIDSVEMDGEEEDAMLEAIQGPNTLDPTNGHFNSHLFVAMYPSSF